MSTRPDRELAHGRMFLGLDGCRNGWVAVRIDGRDHDIRVLSTIAELNGFAHDLAMIDMPIGMPRHGKRRCDLQARALLGSNASRVFTGARRGLWNFASRLEAHLNFRACGDDGVSCQLWGLQRKLKELDDFITPERQRSLRECHPELVFLLLNNGEPLPGKHGKDGQKLRRDLVCKEGIRDIDRWLDVWRRGSGAKVDDILDACACAIAACEATRRIPDEPEIDDRGLAMEIWY